VGEGQLKGKEEWRKAGGAGVDFREITKPYILFAAGFV
jgi:hypothetical protein